MSSVTEPDPRALALWSTARALAAVVIAFALVYQFAHDLSYVRANGTASGSHVPTFATNFLSYFTNQSNIFAATYLCLAACWGFTRGRRGGPQPLALAGFQIFAASCMLLTGVVYNLLLRGDDTDGGIAPFVEWTNELMHVAVPLLMLLEVVASPRPRPVPWGTVFLPVGYALAYVVYTTVRAPFVVSPVGGAHYWYPYPFLNPHSQGGWGGVMVYIAVIAVGFALFAALLVAFVRWRASRSAALS